MITKLPIEHVSDNLLDFLVERFCGIRQIDEMLKPLVEYQKDLEDAFKLDCSPEDLDIFKEAYVCYKKIVKSRKCVDKIKRITERRILK